MKVGPSWTHNVRRRFKLNNKKQNSRKLLFFTHCRKRLQDLMQNLQTMQEENITLSQQQQQQILRPLSAGSRSSRVSRGSSTTSPGPVTFHSPVTSKKVLSPQTLSMEKTLSEFGPGGDRSLPETASSKPR